MRLKDLSLIFTSIALLGAWGCSDSGTYPTDRPSTAKDAGQDQPSSQDMGDTCTPQTCQDLNASCGMHVDGCGGQLDCGPCECDGGQPSEPSCGICGLGSSSCDAGALSCALPELSGLVEQDCESAIFYVDSSHSGEETGSRNAPFKSISAALLASNAQTKLIAIRGGELYRETIIAKDGVHLVGGFDAQWRYNPTSYAIINAPAPQDDHVFGLKLQDITSPTLIANLNISTEDAAPEHANYAVYAHNAAPTTLLRIKAQAGKGGAGVDGTPGETGADGPNGLDGNPGGGVSIPNPIPNPNFGKGGASVMSPCNSSSGAGGHGATSNISGDMPPQAGEPSSGGAPGGRPSYTTAIPAQAGSPGPALNERAMDGPGGKPSSDIENNLWVPKTQAHGTIGENGQSGAGGGGGAGGYYHALIASPSIGGPGGGSGGDGGCGGTGGGGGTSGWASFGLFVTSSEGLNSKYSIFKGAEGGHGRHGAKGGAGGTGGIGGKGSTQVCKYRLVQQGSGGIYITVFEYYDCMTAHSKAGDGGKGANGQQGGAGGGGAGGPSFGAFCVGSTLDVDDSVTFLAGAGGQGGKGGDNQGNDGQDGLSIHQHLCVNQ